MSTTLVSVPATLSGQAVPVNLNMQAQPVGSLNIYSSASNGEEFGQAIQWTDEQRTRVLELIGELTNHADEYDINLSKLISKHPGTDGKFLFSEDPRIGELRDLVRIGLGLDSLDWDSYLEGERTTRSGGDIYVYRGVTLTNYRPGIADAVKVLGQPSLTTGKKHTPEEKSVIFNQLFGGATGLDLTVQILERRKREIKSTMEQNPLTIVSGQERIDQIDRVIEEIRGEKRKADESEEAYNNRSKNNRYASVLGEAINPLDLSKIPTHEGRKDAIKRKRDRIRGQIDDHSSWFKERGERHWCIFDMHSGDKDRVAERASPAGIDNRADAHLYLTEGGSTGDEFFIQLQAMAAKGVSIREIDSFIDTSTKLKGEVFDPSHPRLGNQRAFEAIHNQEDRLWLREALKQMAHGLREIAQNTQIGTHVEDRGVELKERELLGKEMKEKYDAEYNVHLAPFEQALKSGAPLRPLVPPPAPPNLNPPVPNPPGDGRVAPRAGAGRRAPGPPPMPKPAPLAQAQRLNQPDFRVPVARENRPLGEGVPLEMELQEYPDAPPRPPLPDRELQNFRPLPEPEVEEAERGSDISDVVQEARRDISDLSERARFI